MIFKVQLLSLVLFATAFCFGQANNNPCNNAPLLTVGTSCSNSTVTIDGSDNYQQNGNNFGAPSCGALNNAPDVWYAFQAPASGSVDILTAAGTITDAVMEVYSANCSGSYTSIGCNDDFIGAMPQLNLTGLTAGDTYYIRLWEYNGGTGNFDICVTTTVAATGNDTDPCNNATPLTVSTTCNTSVVDLSGATYEANATNFGTPSCGPLSSEPEVWFSFQAPASGIADVQTFAGTVTDAVMEVYSSDCAGTFTSIGCNDDFVGTMPQLNLTGLTPGQTYYVRLWDYGGGNGTFDICVTEPTPPSNDSDPCNNATPLTVGTTCNTSVVDLNGATYEANATNFGAPSCGGLNGTEPEVWFSFQAPASGAVDIETFAVTIFDAVMEVYSSDCAGTFTSIGCNDDFVGTMPGLNLQGLTPGDTYYVRLWEISGGAGTFDICITEDIQATGPCTQGGANVTCGTADPFCTGTVYSYCNTTGQADAFGVGVACTNFDQSGSSFADELFTSPNPAYYYLEVQTAGDLHIFMEQNDTTGFPIDVDFIMWGPFASTSAACTSVTTDETANLVDCSYSGAATEEANIFGASTGDVYMLMITNFSDELGTFTFSQTGGNGATDCSIVVLPVEFGELSAKVSSGAVELNWNTITETNNDYFVVERKTENDDFQPIGKVDGNGNSLEEINYRFVDASPMRDEVNYYRIKQVDFDGAISYSNIRALQVKSELFKAYPNPTTDVFFVNVGEQKAVKVFLSDVQGNVVLESQFVNVADRIQVNCQALNQGVYILNLEAEGLPVHKQMIVVK